MEVKIFGIRIYVRKSILLVLFTFIIILAGIIAEAFIFKNENIVFSKSNSIKEVGLVSTPQISAAPTPQTSNDDMKVYVAGCVKSPGIVTVKKGQIIEDALQLAGGTTDEADVDKINRVYKLKENVMIYVKSKNEQQKQVDQTIEDSFKQPNDAGPAIEIISDSGGSILGGSQGGGSGIQKKININIASEAELDTLPGIGKETAKTIIEFRDKNGDFKDIKDIMKIPGIKESKFNSIKDLISTD